MPPPLSVLQKIDQTFKKVPTLDDPFVSTQYRNRAGQTLIQVLAVKRPHELAAAWQIAWDTGARWREKLDAGRARLPAQAREALAAVIEQAKASRRHRQGTRRRRGNAISRRSNGKMATGTATVHGKTKKPPRKSRL
jgi:hypothetical protein